MTFSVTKNMSSDGQLIKLFYLSKTSFEQNFKLNF